MILGITGGTGCGKTTLLEQLRALGGTVLDCDAIYHHLLETDAELLSAIERRFPGTVENGTLNRKKLGTMVFSDEAALQELNRITHGAVRQEVLCRLAWASRPAAIDAIALFESGLAALCDVTVAVTAPEADRVCRLMARDNISEAYARSRIAAQHDEHWFRERCDHVLENNGTVEAFRGKCVAFLRDCGIIEA